MNMNLISEISINGSPRIGYIYNQCKKMGLWEPFEKGEAKISFTFNGRRLYFKNSKQYKLFRVLYIEFKKAGLDTNEFLDSMPNVIKINEESYSVQNMRNVIRLTESDLHKIIKESVKRILREEEDEKRMQRIWNETFSIQKRLNFVLGKKFGPSVSAKVNPSFRGDRLRITIMPADNETYENLYRNDNILKYLISRITSKFYFSLDTSNYTSDEEGIHFDCYQNDDAMNDMLDIPKSMKSQNGYTNSNDFDRFNINLNSPNDANAIRQSYAGSRDGGYSSSNSMESPNSVNSAYGVRRWHWNN